MQQPIRLVDKLLPGPSGKRRQMDRRRSVHRRRGQLDAQRHAVHVRPCRRRRGAGPLGGLAARHRPAQPSGIDDDPRRPRPVDDSRRPAGLDARRCAHPRHRRRGRGADHRLPRAGTDPRCRQPTTAVHRRVERAEPQRSAGGRRRPSCASSRLPICSTTVAAEVAAVRHRHHNTGVVAPAALHEAIGARAGRARSATCRPRARSRVHRRAGLHARRP